MIYIDTGAFLARYISRDQYHKQALEFWRHLQNSREKCFTSNFVLDEFFTLLARRAGYQFAAQRARNIFSSQVLVILRPDQEDELRAIDFFEKYADQEISFTDCVSFVLMHKRKLKRVFSFDQHFERVGFKVSPLWE